MSVHIKWGTNIIELIPVQCGTKQGGFTSPFIFNVFYEDLINTLPNCNHGVNINRLHLSTFCYADYIFVYSLSVTGLQKMINIATEYIENHGLKFKPHKTICHIMGQNPVTTVPRWYINGVSLDIEDKFTYLGSILGENGGKSL